MKKFKRLVLTAIDSPRRDFEWRLFLASRLASEGVSTAIGPKPMIRGIQERSKNAILFGRLGSAAGRSQGDVRWVEGFSETSTAWLYFHDEGGLYGVGSYADSVKRAYPEPYFTHPRLEKIFFWGREQAEVFEEHVAQNKFQISGAPRFDLMRPQFDSLDAEPVAELHRKYGHYTLVCSRFASANKAEDDAHPLSRRVRDIAVESGLFSDADNPILIRRQFSGWQKVAHEFADFIPAVARLATNNPEHTFVLRPHPAEKSAIYKTAFDSFPNIFVDKSGDARPLIRGAKCVIHSECTTGLEAAINGKPTINFRPWSGDERFEVAGVRNVGLLCRTSEDLLDTFSQVLESDYQIKWDDWSQMTQLVYNADPTSPEATDVIVRSVLETSKQMDGPTTVTPPPLRKKVRTFLRDSLGISRSQLSRRVRLGYVKGASQSQDDTKAYVYSEEKVRALWSSFGGEARLVFSDGVVWVIADEES